MARCGNLQKTVVETDELFNVGSIINQALIEILISKQIISEEELVDVIGKINRQQELFSSSKITPMSKKRKL
jgi:predicted transcriptional regulator